MRFVIVVLALCVPWLTSGPWPTSGMAMADPAPRLVTITGTGTVMVAPGIAEIGASVVSTAPSAEAAVAANSQTVAALFETLAGFDVTADDVRTTGFFLGPQYPADRRGETPSIVGYQASNRIAITLRDIATVGAVLDGMAANGATRIEGIHFAADDPRPHLNVARQRAFADARATAELYAEAAGASLGEVLEIEEGAERATQPRLRALAERAAVPIAPGTNEIRITIRVTFALR